MTGRRTNIIAATAVAGLIFTTAGCGKVADKVTQKATEKATEKVIEKQTGGKVDLDTSGGKMKIKTEDGEFSYDGEGNMTGKTKDGTATYGTGSKLPAEWPSDIKLPKGIKLNAATSAKQDGGVSLAISGTVEKGNAKSIYKTTSSSLKSAGYKLENETEMTSSGSYSATVTGTKGKRTISLTVSDANGSVFVAMNVVPTT